MNILSLKHINRDIFCKNPRFFFTKNWHFLHFWPQMSRNFNIYNITVNLTSHKHIIRFVIMNVSTKHTDTEHYETVSVSSLYVPTKSFLHSVLLQAKRSFIKFRSLGVFNQILRLFKSLIM